MSFSTVFTTFQKQHRMLVVIFHLEYGHIEKGFLQYPYEDPEILNILAEEAKGIIHSPLILQDEREIVDIGVDPTFVSPAGTWV